MSQSRASQSRASRSMASRSTASRTPPMPRCPKCRRAYPTKQALFEHQKKEGHLTCDFCEKCFYTIRGLLSHRQEDHRVEQNLNCPGCNRTFVSAGGWTQHVENGECSAIFPSDIADAIPKIMNAIAGSVKTSGDENISYSGPHHFGDAWDDEWKKEDTFDVEQHPEAFPRTVKQEFYRGGSKQQDLLTGENADNLEQRPQNAWAQKKNLFPEKEKSQAERPPSHLLEEIGQPTPSSRPTGERIIDPYHPEFNVSLFKDSILETYKCPHKSCNSKFKNSKGLIGHLKSPAHSGNQFPCPGCRVLFTTAASFVQHIETVSSTKCRLRENEVEYRRVLGAISNGALDVDIFATLTNNTMKLKIDENWAEAKQPSKPQGVVGSEAWLKAKQNETNRSLPGPNKTPQNPW
ncbi:hypothetical protein F5Y06DRAFT_306282 [Hypoxylon sp. FL0890]|nr:hypothetical protein F5Y06DRAFT_306282 [Hypoxylon sp. FL0890]